jgi:hypothetical protein
MRGYVEVYKDYGTPQQELVEASNNLIVDSGGEMIVDLMTLPLGGSGIASASAIYDASNYTIRAVSFGKDASAYAYNAHGVSPLQLSGQSNGHIWGLVGSVVSSYTPTNFLPKYPTPYDTKLEIIPSSYLSIGSGTFDSLGNVTSALSALAELGQLINVYNYYAQLYTGTQQARWYLRAGCWPRSTTNTLYIINYTNSSIVATTTTSSNFNVVSSMDWRGFVTTTSSTNPLSGLVTSSTATFSSTGEIIYQITIASGDANVANMYGGITQMGLWGLNTKSMLSAGRTPPYSFHPYTNVLDYKLFSKKTFNKNIVGISDNGSSAGLTNYSNLTIIWRIFFL